MSKIAELIEEEGLFGLKPRTRCICCGATTAQVLEQYDKYAVIEGQYLDKGGERVTAIEKEGWICWPCLEMEEVEPKATVFLHANDERYGFRVGSYAIIETGDDEVPGDLFEKVIRPYAERLNWHPSDPWRGAYIGSINSGWQKVIDDWFGTMDGHNIGDNDLGKFYEKYEKQKEVPDFSMLVCFPRTSNCCSCGIEVYTPEVFVDSFKEWIGVELLEMDGGKSYE